MKATAYNPFFIIDAVGYRTKYEPCEKLNLWANELKYKGHCRLRCCLFYVLMGGKGIERQGIVNALK
jgi:hypothetical protein